MLVFAGQIVRPLLVTADDLLAGPKRPPLDDESAFLRFDLF